MVHLVIQDDVFNTAQSREKEQDTNTKIEKMLGLEQLDLNLEKKLFSNCWKKESRRMLLKT